MNDEQRTARIRELNDQIRQQVGLPGMFIQHSNPHRILVTRGIEDSLAPEAIIELWKQIREYDAFSEDNNPHQEHDFGALTIDGNKVFFKIDYYTRDLQYGSEDPADPAKTCRVLTIMLAEEY